MKKYFFIIGLLATIFLGLGNATFAKTEADCTQEYNNCKIAAGADLTGCTNTRNQCKTQLAWPTCSGSTTQCETAAQCSCTNNTCKCLTAGQVKENADSARQAECTGALKVQTLDSNQSFLCACSNIPASSIATIIPFVSQTQMQNGGKGPGCCVIDASSGDVPSLPVCTSADQNAGESCTNPAKANAHVNGFGKCVCNDKYTDVNGVCELCTKPGVCCGVKLNTNIPFIGNCIETSAQDSTSKITETTAFPFLIAAIVKILMSVILIGCFIMIIIGGVMIAAARDDATQAASGKKMITNVVIAIAVLGAIGVLLRLINPNFFG